MKYRNKMKLVLILFANVMFLLSYAQDIKVFKDPNNCYGPYVWWHWLGPNFSENGITKDLEAMKRIWSWRSYYI